MTSLGVAACILVSVQFSPAQYLWSELTQGDLSDDRLAPSAFLLSPGDNFLFGQIDGNDGQGNIDRDYFSITIPGGHQLSELVLYNYASTDFAAFMGIQPGPIFPNDPDFVTPGDLMGWTLFGPSHIATDLLPAMGQNGMGFSPPIPAGIYTFWVQQLDDFTEWTGDFVVTEVPEPSSLGLMLAGCLSFVRRRTATGRPVDRSAQRALRG